jgi:exonuclease I
VTSQISKDIERKVLQTVQDTMKRELAIAQHVMEPAEIGILLMQIAKGAVTTAAATIAGMTADRETMFDTMVDMLVEQVRREKPNAMAEIAKMYGNAAA